MSRYLVLGYPNDTTHGFERNNIWSPHRVNVTSICFVMSHLCVSKCGRCELDYPIMMYVHLWALYKPPNVYGENKMGREGGTNRSDIGLNLSGSWQQGHSATYNTPSRI